MKRLLYRHFWGQPFRNSFFAALQYSLRETHGVHPPPPPSTPPHPEKQKCLLTFLMHKSLKEE